MVERRDVAEEPPESSPDEMEERRDEEFAEDAERSLHDRISEEKYEQWLYSLKAKLGLASRGRFNQSIYRVPRRGKQQQENDPYTPRLVSIGPFQHRKRDFLYTEEDKYTSMLQLLKRTRDPVEALQEFANAIRRIERDARRCYAADLELEELEMVERLLVDGCFILEYFIRYPEVYQQIEGNTTQVILDLQVDMALLENQIPFSVLELLFQKISDTKKDGQLPYPFTRYALFFFRSSLNLSDEAFDQFLNENPHDNWNFDHLLDMLRDIYCKTVADDNKVEETAAAIRVVCEEGSTIQVGKQQGFQRTARGLHLAGIQLVKGDAKEFLGMSFHNENGVGILRIPCLCIDRRTYVIFKNLIAYEQLATLDIVPVSSYAVLLNSLIKSSHDVKILKQKGIIVQTPGETLDVFSFVRDLASEASFEYGGFHFAPLCERVNKHMQRLKITRSLRVRAGMRWVQANDYWDRSVSLLKLDYLGNFWTVLSVAAATILLVLTALQTFYTVLGYYHQ